MNTRAKNIVLAFIYYCLSCYVYVYCISPLFSYAGFVTQINYSEFYLGLFVVMLYYSFVSDKGAVANYLHLLLVFVFVPSMVIFAVGPASLEYFFVILSCCTIVIFLSTYIKVPSFKLIAFKQNQIIYIFLALIVFYILGIFAQGGYRYLNFNIGRVYEFRSEAAINLHPLFGYLSSIIGKIVLPLFVVISVIQKRRVLLLLGIFFSVLIFALTAHKSPLFYPWVVLFVYWFSKKRFSSYLLLSCVALVTLSIIDFSLKEKYGFHFGWFGTLVARRAILVSPLLNHFYIEFFSLNEVYFWSSSKISLGLLTPPHDLSSVNLIGSVYFGNPEMSANTGWIGSGFANARLLGAIVYSIGLGMLISLLGAFGEKIGGRLVFSVSVILLLAVYRSTDLVTAFLTHGVLFLLIILSVLPRK